MSRHSTDRQWAFLSLKSKFNFPGCYPLTHVSSQVFFAGRLSTKLASLGHVHVKLGFWKAVGGWNGAAFRVLRVFLTEHNGNSNHGPRLFLPVAFHYGFFWAVSENNLLWWRWKDCEVLTLVVIATVEPPTIWGLGRVQASENVLA